MTDGTTMKAISVDACMKHAGRKRHMDKCPWCLDDEASKTVGQMLDESRKHIAYDYERRLLEIGEHHSDAGVHADDPVDGARRVAQLVKRMRQERDELVDAVVAAYRKHKHDDENIGWNELTTILSNAGANALGDGEWLARVGAEDVGEW